MRKDNVRGTALILIVLPPADRGDVGRYASVDDDVFLARVFRHRHATYDLKAMTRMDLLGDLAEDCV